MNVILSKGWVFTLGVFAGYQVAKLADRLPFVAQATHEIRSLVDGIGVLPDDEDDDGEADDE
ncbi:hypothetical protein [Saccharomonospora viridis]|uniref:hypothetical protein n=1 Tax=Saccharomonospora viridis TaxID=1852 RepID=UPI00240A416D|nr:hypothetical protein [Saccharomonospora viridis]